MLKIWNWNSQNSWNVVTDFFGWLDYTNKISLTSALKCLFFFKKSIGDGMILHTHERDAMTAKCRAILSNRVYKRYRYYQFFIGYYGNKVHLKLKKKSCLRIGYRFLNKIESKFNKINTFSRRFLRKTSWGYSHWYFSRYIEY